MSTWQIDEAQRHFEDIIDKLSAEGPQTITVDGQERAVLVSIETYRALITPHFDSKGPMINE